MITRIFNTGRAVWQTADADGAPELPILCHVDAGGTICLDQEGQSIVLNPATVDDLVKALRELRKDAYARK